MSSAVIQLLVLAGIAIFLILRLRNVLGTREGFEKPPVPMGGESEGRRGGRRDFEVIEGGVDTDITDHVPDGSPAAKALAAMKIAEPGFNVGEFLHGARGAYEMILMAFENGDLDSILPFLSRDVYETFAEVVELRESQGLKVEATFVGIRELSLVTADYNRDTQEAEVTVRFVGELTSVVKNAAGEVVEGNPNEIKRQKDVWTFARKMGMDNPNWQLVATGE
jgi:predicted lipid-binding transport protein (Tim44 family)